MKKSEQAASEKQPNRMKFTSSEFLAFSIVMTVVLFITAVVPLYPNDFFPYLRIAEEVVNTGRIPPAEFMTYTNYGKPANFLYWLPSVFLLGVYELGGITLTVFLSMLCIGGFYLFLWLALRELRVSMLTAVLSLVLIAFVHALFFTMRPQVLAYPLFGLALLLTIRWQRGDNRHLWIFPIIAMLWANTHGSFIILFFMLFPALIFGPGDRKRLAVFTVLSLAATLINYFGIIVWTNIFSMVNNQAIRSYITEWLPPVNEGWQLNLFYMGMLVMPLAAAFSKAKVRLVYWVWYLGFGWMALTSVRYIIWFLPFQAVLLSTLIDPLLRKLVGDAKHFQNRTLNLAIGTCFLVFPLTLLPGVRDRWLPEPPPAYDRMTPLQATEWLQDNPQLPDNLWSDFHFSCYFAYELPQRKLFMANRIQDLSIELINDYYHISSAAYNWEALLEKYNINLMIPSIEQSPELIDVLSASPVWEEIYRDEQAVIFQRGQSVISQ